MSEEYDPFFCFAHDYSAHRYECEMVTRLNGSCTCGYSKAWKEAEAFVARLSAAEQERDDEKARAKVAEARLETARGDLRRESLRTEMAFRERDSIKARVEAAEQALTHIARIEGRKAGRIAREYFAARAALAGREEHG